MKLIEGHTYEDGNGNSHKVTTKGGWPDFPFASGTRRWTARGAYLTAYATDCDLIKDVTEYIPCLADDNDIQYISIFAGEGKYGDTEYNDGMVDGVSIDDIHTHMLRLRRKLYGYNRLVAKGIFHARKTK